MMELKLELVLIPVADVDRAKAFYTEKLGFNLDVDTSPTEGFRVVQMTLPASTSSITIGTASRMPSPVLIGERTWSGDLPREPGQGGGCGFESRRPLEDSASNLRRCTGSDVLRSIHSKESPTKSLHNPAKVG
jgi:catechol 2,3-dioxygenase-like lactoylglutathione lyase family enzyme